MLRKWRPSHKCIYVIPEIHGNMRSLEVILNRILPLRKFENQQDDIVFLGDYIDGDDAGAYVIDTLINIKKEYPNRAFFIKGNHEEMMLKAILGGENDFKFWTDCGGHSTIASYLKKNNLQSSPYSIKKNRIKDIIPQTHIDFLQSLSTFSVLEDYLFIHGGFDVDKSVHEQNTSSVCFDNMSSKYVKDCLKNKQEPTFKDNYIVVAAHNFEGKEPFLYKNYFMLGGTAPNKLLVLDLNSMDMEAVSRGKSRIYKYDFNIYE